MKGKIYTTGKFLIFCFVFVTLPQLIRSQACPGLGSVTLNVVAAPQPSLNFVNQLCPGGNTTISVNQTFSTYSWSTGANGQSINVNNPGNYTVTVTNAGGCTVTAVAAIQPNVAPTPNIASNPYACNGSLVLNAGAGFSAYSWSNGGGSGSTATYTAPGTYTVTVTNSFGCTGTDDFTVNIPPPPAVSVTGGASFCTGGNTTLNATPGFSTYTWSVGGNSASVNVNAGGTFTVTVTDAFGCTATNTATVTELPFTNPTITGAGILCPGANITLNVPGAYATYSWSNGQAGPSITETNPGAYTVTVTASNGCSGTAVASVNPGGSTTTSILGNLNLCVGTATNLIASGAFTNYAWSNGGSGSIINVNTAGTYTVTVTNNNGCTGTASATLTEVQPPSVAVSGGNQICPGGNLSLNATPGLSTYAWSAGGSGPGIVVNNPGNYTVTVTNTFGCSATAGITITPFPQPVPLVTGTTTVCQGGNTVFSVTNPFVQYAWSNGQNTPTISANAAGAYTVTVTDANGCTGTDTEVLNIIPNPTPNIAENPYACNNQLTLNAGGAFTTYNWNTGVSTPSITISTAGTYTVTVTNAQGCTGVDTYAAAIPALPTVAISGNNQLCTGSTTVLSASGGLNSYAWSTGQNGVNITVGSAGNYTVTVTDNNGCTASSAISVVGIPTPNPSIAGPGSICAGTFATFSVPGVFTAYQWSTGESTPSIEVNTSGAYTVTVTATNGCTGTDVQTLNITTSLSPQIIEEPYNCNGQVTLDAGIGFTTYNWSNGATSPTLTVNTSANYTVTVTDAVGCTGSAIYAVSIPQPPTVAINGITDFCQGGNTELTASPGLSTYVWSNGLIGATITVAQAGNYEVTATDVFGCETTANVNVNAIPVPNVLLSGPSVICVNSTGTLTASGGVNYTWSTGATTPSIPINTGGVYTVVGSNNAGCTGVASITVNVANNLSPSIATQPYQCNGQFNLDAGVGFNTYVWSSGQTTAAINVNQSGVYSVTVTDNTGCTGVDALDVTIPTPPATTISGNTAFCASSATTLDAGAGFISYQWSTGANANTINVNQAGAYTVTVTDAEGCTASASISVNSLPNPVVDISGAPTACAGNNPVLNAGAAFAAYNWSEGSTTNAITALASGPYTVTVTDNNGCTGVDQIDVQIFPNPTTQINEAPYDCSGAITVNAGSGFATYAWSNGGASASIAVSASGAYTVTVTDNNGCTAIANSNVNVPALPSVSISGIPGFCPGASASLTATNGFVGYNWSTGANTPDITVNSADTYSVTVTDNLGCTATNTFTTTQFPSPVADISGPASVCPGNTATLSANGVFAAYNWDNGAQTPTIVVNPPATATLTVTDQNGCTAVAIATVVVSNQITPQISVLPYDCSGQLTLNAGNGFPQYNWDNGATSATTTVTSSGTYNVTVSDGAGCSGTAAVQVNIPAAPVVTISGNAPICPGASATLVADGGFTSYNWSVGNNTNTITVNAGGNYILTVTDALGCTASASANVATLPPPAVQISGPNVICGVNPVQLLATGSFANIAWSNGQNTPAINTATPGNYEVTVTDNQGCTSTAQWTLNTGTNLQPSVSLAPYACDGQLTITTPAGQGAYLWSNGATGASLVVNTAGTYTVTVSDNAGCSGTASLDVTIPALPVVNISGSNALCPGALGALNATPGFQNYLWNTGAATASISVTAGPYTVTITDANGCTATNTLQVQALSAPQPQITNQPYACDGTLSFQANAGFSNYLWSTGSTANSVIVTQNGAYTVTVTDNNGCTGATQTQAAIPPPVLVVLNGNNSFCQGQTATINSNAGFATYLWSNGATTGSITVNQGGNYALTVSDAQGCTGAGSFNVTAFQSPTPSINVQPEDCAGAMALNTGATFSAYLWSNQANSAAITVTQAGQYTVTVTNAEGCTGTAIATVNIVQSDTTVQTLTSCNPDNVGSQVLTFNGSNGCDSIVIINTVLNTAVLTGVITSGNNFNGFDVSCAGANDGLAVVGINGAAAPISYQWSNGVIDNPVIQNVPSGIYSVTFTDAQGCTGAATIELTAPLPITTSVEIEPADCFDQGSITLQNIQGGVGPFDLRFGTLVLQDESGNQALEITPTDFGDISLEITDNNGCVLETTYNFPEPAEFVQTVSDTIEIIRGQTAVLDASAITISSLNISWTPDQPLSCNDCLTPTASPSVTTLFELSVQGLPGCTGNGLFLVLVKSSDRKIFVPNVIQPNDPNNSGFTIFGDNTLFNIKSLQVYDRWGGQMALFQNIAPNDPSAGWDGRYRNREAEPGVYTFWAELEYTDGSTEVIKGDVTLVR